MLSKCDIYLRFSISKLKNRIIKNFLIFNCYVENNFESWIVILPDIVGMKYIKTRMDKHKNLNGRK